jgi:predicted phage-related endonuclease|tara:strand:+ start:4717 stop:4989 length:273 start_codon:yes stop_codon:yes gene_type:complete
VDIFKTNKLWQAQNLCLKTLEMNLKSLEDATKELQSKVKNDKLDAFYSQNSDCLVYATKVWNSCLRLAELKKLQWELEGRDSAGRLITED